jgi:hypothetical protein
MISLIGLILVTPCGASSEPRRWARERFVPKLHPLPMAEPLMILTACRVDVSPKSTWEISGRFRETVLISSSRRVWRIWGCDEAGIVERVEMRVGRGEEIGVDEVRMGRSVQTGDIV